MSGGCGVGTPFVLRARSRALDRERWRGERSIWKWNYDGPVRIQRIRGDAVFAGTVGPRQPPVHFFAYTLTIRNTGQVAAQLISRHWIITDSDNHVQEVKGLGVVGHQPLLPPGEQFEYTSWAVIATPVGTMRGEYFCVAEDGERFEAPVPEFALHMPRTLH